MRAIGITGSRGVTSVDYTKPTAGGNTTSTKRTTSNTENNEYDNGIQLVEGEWCAGLVTYALAKNFGGLEKIPDNFNEDCTNHNTCYSYAHWAKDKGILTDKRENPEDYDIKKVQAGDLILFNTYNDKSGENVDEWCHIGMVTGISDDGKPHTQLRETQNLMMTDIAAAKAECSPKKQDK